MPAPISPEVCGKVLAFLGLNYSHWKIIKTLKKQNINITSGTITNIKKRSESGAKKVKNVSNCGRKSVLTERQISTLNNMTSNKNPLSQQRMASKIGTERYVVSYHIRKKLKKKVVKKPKCHALTAKTIEKRYRRSWPLYLKLRGQRWRKFITSDEALFHITDADGKTKIQYKTIGKRDIKLEIHTKVQFPKGVMA